MYKHLGILLVLVAICGLGCSTPPKKPAPKEELGWHGEKLPPGIKRRLQVKEGEPSFRRADGTETSEPKEAKEYVRVKDRSVMVYVPKGQFTMGDNLAEPHEKPQLKVNLSPYYIDKYEVSNRQFAQFASASDYKSAAEKTGKSLGWSGKQWKALSGIYWKNPYPKQVGPGYQASHPVIHIARADAVAYAKWAGADLPTEAQWEKAARGEEAHRFPWGRESPQSGGVYRANYAVRGALANPSRENVWKNRGKDGFEYTAPVGSFPRGASPYGCMDMIGNVWEWCKDNWEKKFYQRIKDEALKDPNKLNDIYAGKPSKFGTIRGGGWTWAHRGHHLASRGGNKPGYTAADLGFRCVVPG